MNHLYKYILVIAIIAIIGVQCQPPKEEFNKQSMLTTIATAYIQPTLQDLDKHIILLESNATIFLNNPTTSALLPLQGSWKNSMKLWSEIEMLDFGPANEQFIYLELDNTPINTTSIERMISDTTLIDSTTILNSSSYTKGLATIEYLLFSATSPQNLVDSYDASINTNATRRAAYLINTIKNVKGLVKRLSNLWNENGGNYAIVNNTANEKEGGISRFVNAITHISQTMSRKKVGKPLGKEAFGNIPNINLVESKYANFSWEIILHNLYGLRAIFGINDNNRLGSYLSHLLGDEELTNKVVQQIATVEQLLLARQQSLQSDIQNNPAEVEVIYQELKALYELIAIDVSSSFSIAILPNPDDGD